MEHCVQRDSRKEKRSSSLSFGYTKGELGAGKVGRGELTNTAAEISEWFGKWSIHTSHTLEHPWIILEANWNLEVIHLYGTHWQQFVCKRYSGTTTLCTGSEKEILTAVFFITAIRTVLETVASEATNDTVNSICTGKKGGATFRFGFCCRRERKKGARITGWAPSLKIVISDMVKFFYISIFYHPKETQQ